MFNLTVIENNGASFEHANLTLEEVYDFTEEYAYDGLTLVIQKEVVN